MAGKDWRRLGKRQKALLYILDEQTYGNQTLNLLWIAVSLRKLGFRGNGTAWVECTAGPLQERGFVEIRGKFEKTSLFLTQQGQDWCDLNPKGPNK